MHAFARVVSARASQSQQLPRVLIKAHCRFYADRNLTDLLSQATTLAKRVDSAVKSLDEQENWTALRTEYNGLRDRLKDDSIWQNEPLKAVDFQKRISHLEERLKMYDGLKSKALEGLGMLDMIREERDTELAQEVVNDLENISADLETETFRILM